MGMVVVLSGTRASFDPVQGEETSRANEKAVETAMETIFQSYLSPLASEGVMGRAVTDYFCNPGLSGAGDIYPSVSRNQSSRTARTGYLCWGAGPLVGAILGTPRAMVARGIAIPRSHLKEYLLRNCRAGSGR